MYGESTGNEVLTMPEIAGNPEELINNPNFKAVVREFASVIYAHERRVASIGSLIEGDPRGEVDDSVKKTKEAADVMLKGTFDSAKNLVEGDAGSVSDLGKFQGDSEAARAQAAKGTTKR